VVLNAQLNRWEQINRFAIIDRELSIEASDLTPSLKLRRKVVVENFADRLSALYKRITVRRPAGGGLPCGGGRMRDRPGQLCRALWDSLVRVRAPDGRDYYRRKRAAGKSHREALRCLKRRLSDAVYRQLVRDADTLKGAGPAGHTGATPTSCAAGSHPVTSTSDKSLTGPAKAHPTTGDRTA